MKKSDTQVLVMGSQGSDTGISGVTHVEQLESLPMGFSGHIWIEAIETVGPYLRSREKVSPAP